jgi:hypothetical protein
MRDTDEILADLRRRAEAGEDVRQQIISHETIARLRAELAGVDTKADPERAAGLRNQIGVHERLVDEQPAPAKAGKPKPAAA